MDKDNEQKDLMQGTHNIEQHHTPDGGTPSTATTERQAGQQNNNRRLIIIGSIIIALLIAAIIALFVQNTTVRQQNEDYAAMEEQMTFEKEQLEKDYQELANNYGQIDGMNMTLSNDSLVEQLAQERQHVLDLMEELKNTRATDARKIAALRKELETLRTVMRQYVAQIDSLNTTNKRLETENKEVKTRLQASTQENEQLRQDREQLTSVVQRAAMMEVGNVHVTRLNAKGRETKHYGKIAKLQIDFTVQKNITTEPGNKRVYLRITRPDGEVMTKNANTFAYEDKHIAYSLNKDFEYTGDAIALTLYWNVEEVLQIGTYSIDFFIDGNMVGSFPFKIEK